MVKWRSVNPLRLLLVGFLCFSLGGCGLMYPHLPRSVVASAIASQLNQTQAILFHQLELPVQPQATVTVRQVKIIEHHWTTVEHQSVLQVRGTYRLSGAGWRQQPRSQLFQIYLQRDRDQHQWVSFHPSTPDYLQQENRQAGPIQTLQTN